MACRAFYEFRLIAFTLVFLIPEVLCCVKCISLHVFDMDLMHSIYSSILFHLLDVEMWGFFSNSNIMYRADWCAVAFLMNRQANTYESMSLGAEAMQRMHMH